MAEEIVFEDPPASKRPGRRSVWAERLEQLVAHPNKWARFESKSSSSAHGAAKLLGAGRFEFAQRTVDGKAYTFARYLGQGTLVACKKAGCGRKFATADRRDQHMRADHA